MRRLSDESGLTLIELLVATTLSLIIFGAVMGALEIFSRQDTYDQQRNEAQDSARTTVDRLSLELRNVAAPTAGSPGSLEQVGPYDIVFELVSPNTVFGGSNAINQMRVRYCLDNTTPTDETIWRQTQTWTTSTAPSVPSTTTCPGTVGTGAWTTKAALAQNVTNEMNSQNRPLFTCQASGTTGNACTTTTTSTSGVKAIQADIFQNLNPSQLPGESELTDGIDLRNALSTPIAAFTVSQVQNHYVVLNGATSNDPNGQTLSYQWYQGSSCTAGALAGANSEQYSSTYLASGTYTFDLLVTNLGGLTACATPQSVTIN